MDLWDYPEKHSALLAMCLHASSRGNPLLEELSQARLRMSKGMQPSTKTMTESWFKNKITDRDNEKDTTNLMFDYFREAYNLSDG